MAFLSLLLGPTITLADTIVNSSGIIQCEFSIATPLDATDYYGCVGGDPTDSRTTNLNWRFYAPMSGIITDAYIEERSGTGGSATGVIYYALVNGTDYIIDSSVPWDSGLNTGNGVNLHIPINKGSYLLIHTLTPTWATNPLSVYSQVQLFIQSTSTITTNTYGDTDVNNLLNASSSIPKKSGNSIGDLLYWTGSIWGTEASSSVGGTGSTIINNTTYVFPTATSTNVYDLGSYLSDAIMIFLASMGLMVYIWKKR